MQLPTCQLRAVLQRSLLTANVRAVDKHSIAVACDSLRSIPAFIHTTFSAILYGILGWSGLPNSLSGMSHIPFRTWFYPIIKNYGCASFSQFHYKHSLG